MKKSLAWQDSHSNSSYIPNDALETINLLTYKKGIPYMKYVESLKDNNIVRKVKLADLAHNSDLSRLPEVSGTTRVRARKYNEQLNCSAAN